MKSMLFFFLYHALTHFTRTQTINKSFTFFPPEHTHTHTERERRQGLCVWLVRNEEIKLSIVLPISAAVTTRCLGLTRRRLSAEGERER